MIRVNADVKFSDVINSTEFREMIYCGHASIPQAQAPGNANWAALTPEQRRRARLEHEIATGQTNNGGVVASLRPSAIEKRKQELAAMGDAGKLPSPGSILEYVEHASRCC